MGFMVACCLVLIYNMILQRVGKKILHHSNYLYSAI